VEHFYLAMLGEGNVLTPELAGCVSTPMTEEHADALIAATDRVFDSVVRGYGKAGSASA